MFSLWIFGCWHCFGHLWSKLLKVESDRDEWIGWRMSKMKPLVPCSSWLTFNNSLGDANPGYPNMNFYVRTQEFCQLVLARLEVFFCLAGLPGNLARRVCSNFYSSRSRANFQANRQSSDKKMRQTKVESDGGFNNEGNVIFFQGMISQVDRNVVFCDWFVTTI